MRVAALALALIIGATSEASACLSSYYFRGIAFYDAIPEQISEHALVLDVVFDADQVAIFNGVVTARVRRVLQGDYTANTIRVGLGNSSCTSSFEFGREGIIVGELVTAAEGRERAANRPGAWEGLALDWPYRETVLVPIEEGRNEREMRIANLTRSPDPYFYAQGDFDGDGATDDVHYFESNEGALVIGVRLSSLQSILGIWGGDISSLPRFTFRTAPPGRYITDCEAYGPECGGEAPARTLTHDGIIVEGLEDQSRTLYFWSGGEFKNVSILEPRP